jgi:hypothetical protein
MHAVGVPSAMRCHVAARCLPPATLAASRNEMETWKWSSRPGCKPTATQVLL